MEINGQKVKDPIALKFSLPLFFLFHYGMFHFVYFVFLANLRQNIFFMSAITGGSFTSIESAPTQTFGISLGSVLVVAGFFLNHLYSYYKNKKNDQMFSQNLSRLFSKPYARILPMHLTIVFGGSLIGFTNNQNVVALALFMILKAVADVIYHVREHKPAQMPMNASTGNINI